MVLYETLTNPSIQRDIYNGNRKYPFPTPLIPGTSFIGRVAAVGADATKIKAGDLVFVDCVVRSRDEPADVFLASIVQGRSEYMFGSCCYGTC